VAGYERVDHVVARPLYSAEEIRGKEVHLSEFAAADEDVDDE
jgi:hypothetical protein